MKDREFETLQKVLKERYPGFEIEVQQCKDSSRLFAVQLYKPAIPPMLIGDGPGFLWAWDKSSPGKGIRALFAIVDEAIESERCCETCKRPL